MLYLAAFRTCHDGTADPSRVMPLPPSVSYPADMEAAATTAASFADAAAGRAVAFAVRAAWSAAVAPPGGGPDRAPAGVLAAVEAGDLASEQAPGRVRVLGRSLHRAIAPSADRSRSLYPDRSIGRSLYPDRSISEGIAPHRAIAPFLFRANYNGIDWYIAQIAGQSYRLEMRVKAGPDERRISSADDATWTRDIVGSVGVLRYGSDPTKPLPQSVVDAFNDWRLTRFVQDIADIAADPDKYGTLTLSQVADLAPMVAHAAYWTPQGWRRP